MTTMTFDQKLALKEYLDFQLAGRDQRIAAIIRLDGLSLDAASQLADQQIMEAVERLAFASSTLDALAPASPAAAATPPQSTVSDRTIVYERLIEQGISPDRAFRLVEDPAIMAEHAEAISEFRRNEAERYARQQDQAYADSPEGRRAAARAAIEARKTLEADAELARVYLLEHELATAEMLEGVDPARLVAMAFPEPPAAPPEHPDPQFASNVKAYGFGHVANAELREEYEAQKAEAAGEVS